MIKFIEKDHFYQSVDPDNISWMGVTSLISKFKQKFDSEFQAKKSSKNSKSKWYNIPPEEILQAWNSETKRSETIGRWYHTQREEQMISHDTITKEGIDLPIIRPIITDGIKYAPDQRLVEGIYPEHLIYLRSVGICGQADRVEIIRDAVSIYDFKTNKEIKTHGFRNWEGMVQRMLPPLSHLDDCHLVHYTLQMSFYLYIILKHNPFYKSGTLELNHIIFEEESKNKYGYPVHKLVMGEPVVKEVKSYKLPFMKSEVIKIIEWLSENKHNIIKKS